MHVVGSMKQFANYYLSAEHYSLWNPKNCLHSCVVTKWSLFPMCLSMYNVKLVLTLHVKYDVWHLFKKAWSFDKDALNFDWLSL